MFKEPTPQARLKAILREQQKLVNELKEATPGRQLQIQAESVALTEEQIELLEEVGDVNFVFTNSNRRGTGWIEEEYNYDGSVRQYRYGCYRAGKSNRKYIPKALVGEVQEMMESGTNPEEILEFLDKSKTRTFKTKSLSTT